MLQELALWLNAIPLRYWIVAWLAFAACLLSAVLPHPADNRIRHWNSPIVFAVSLFFLLFAFRWPGLRLNFQLINPDESEMIASAMAYRHFGTLWGHVTDSTVGPLIPLPLVIPSVFGFPFDYTVARFVGLLFSWSILVFVWLTLRRIHGDRYSRLLILPLACGLAFTTFSDFVQYSTEPPALAYLLFGLLVLVTAFSPSGKIVSRFRLAVGGFVLGLLPVAKPQVAPLGLVIGLWGIGRLIVPAAGPTTHRCKAAVCLIGGTLLALFSLFVSLWWSDELHFFWATYIVGNMHYAGNRTYAWSEFPFAFWSLAKLDGAYATHLVSALALLVLAMPLWPRLTPMTRHFVAVAGMLFVIAFWTVVAPGRSFYHYLQILPPFLTLFLGFLYNGLLTEKILPRRQGVLFLILYVVLGLGPQITLRLTEHNPYLGAWQEGRQTHYAQYAQAVSRRVTSFVQRGDTMTVWGWAPMLHVEIGLPQATRVINSPQEMRQGPDASYLRRLYLAELEYNRPAIFLDAANTQPFMSADGKALQPHETNPAVRDFVAKNYVLVDDIAQTRIYVRRDRVAPQ